MNYFDRIALVFDMLEGAELLHEFDDSVTLKVDRELWNDCILFMKQDAEWEPA